MNLFLVDSFLDVTVCDVNSMVCQCSRSASGKKHLGDIITIQGKVFLKTGVDICDAEVREVSYEYIQIVLVFWRVKDKKPSLTSTLLLSAINILFACSCHKVLQILPIEDLLNKEIVWANFYVIFSHLYIITTQSSSYP